MEGGCKIFEKRHHYNSVFDTSNFLNHFWFFFLHSGTIFFSTLSVAHFFASLFFWYCFYFSLKLVYALGLWVEFKRERCRALNKQQEVKQATEKRTSLGRRVISPKQAETVEEEGNEVEWGSQSRESCKGERLKASGVVASPSNEINLFYRRPRLHRHFVAMRHESD